MASKRFQKFQSRYEIYISPLPASEPIVNILNMFEEVGRIKNNQSHSGPNFASCRITYDDERAARDAIAMFNGTEFAGVKMTVSPVRGSYPYQDRSSTDWDCWSCESINFDFQKVCFQCQNPRGAESRKVRRRYSRSPARHRRSGDNRDREYGGEGRGIYNSPDHKRKFKEDRSSRGHSRNTRSPRGPAREERLSDHRERREEKGPFDCQKKTRSEEEGRPGGSIDRQRAEERRYSRSPARHRRSGDDRDRKYGGEGRGIYNVNISIETIEILENNFPFFIRGLVNL